MAKVKKTVGRGGQAGLETDPRQAQVDLRELGEGLEIRAKSWITAGGETFLAYGRILLLEKIHDFGSISAAARSIGMSYRRAWWHIEAMNRLSKRPLVETAVGGRGGGGARLTSVGEAAVRVYRLLDSGTKAFEERAQEELGKRS